MLPQPERMQRLLPEEHAPEGEGEFLPLEEEHQQKGEGDSHLGQVDEDPQKSGEAARLARAGAAEEPEDEEEDDFLLVYNLRREWRVGVKSLIIRAALPEEHYRTLDDAADPRPTSRDGSKPWYILSPTSRLRLCWDIITMVLVAHDMAVIPVEMAFETGDNLMSDLLFYPCLLFWSADIPLTFMTGIYRKGRVETNSCHIAKEYVCTWLLLDVSMVAAIWSEAIIGLENRGVQLGRVGKTLRIVRVVRSMRLLRLVKIRKIIEDLQERVTSEHFHILMNVLKMILIIVCTNHFIACGWWALGVSGPRQGGPGAERSWTSNFGLQDDDLSYQYFTALHWSLTQFTPASMEIFPRSLSERIFAVLVLVFAMIVFSSFVSSITAAMTQLRQLSSSMDKHWVMLRRYLRARNTPTALTVRIMRCVEHQLSHRKDEIPESDVALLQHLSKPLQMELLSHIYAPILMRHPFFRRYGQVDPVAMQHVCHSAVQRISLSTGDNLFTEACRGEQMFFVRSGRLRYYPSSSYSRAVSNTQTQEDSTSLSHRSSGACRKTSSAALARSAAMKLIQEFIFDKEEWFCESSLWCPWAHWGSMVAMRMAEVIAVNAPIFADISARYRLVASGAQLYATAFVERLNAAVQEGDIRDVCQVQEEDLERMALFAFPLGTGSQSSAPSLTGR